MTIKDKRFFKNAPYFNLSKVSAIDKGNKNIDYEKESEEVLTKRPLSKTALDRLFKMICG